jgi:hypothetical protein
MSTTTKTNGKKSDKPASEVRDGKLQCSRCEQRKSVDDFPKDKSRTTRESRYGYCRDCESARKKKARNAKPKETKVVAAATKVAKKKGG